MMRLAVLAALFSSSAALACTCPWPGYARAFATSGVAFEGVADSDGFDVPFNNQFGTVIRVTRVFKGEVAPYVIVTSVNSTCGNFALRGSPMVFLISPELDGVFSYETYGCDGTLELSRLTPSELAVLGPGKPPTPRSPLPAVVALSILLTLMGWLLRRRAKKRTT